MDIQKQPVTNFDNVVIDVQFIVIHYTALDLKQTIERFNQIQSKASSHFVIDIDGSIHQCVAALSQLDQSEKNNFAFKAWHCGVSKYDDKENLNNYSIGIEMINPNGNFFEYSTNQYKSLIWLTKKLIEAYPNLNHPNQIIGHENIAGFRGKIDPGYCFNWRDYFEKLFFDSNKVNIDYKARKTINQNLYRQTKEIFEIQSSQLDIKNRFWAYFNNWLEYSQSQLNAINSNN